jgi:hypothetical protein
MLVVSDTSPVSSLVQIGHGELLQKLFGTVCIPVAVRDELVRFHATLPSFVEVRDVVDRARVNSFMPSLDLGEAEAIVLAIEAHADHLLIDERRGRSIAMQAGIPIIGLLGVLLLAKERGLISAVSECIFGLQTQAGFYVSEALIQRAPEAAGESGVE